MTFKSAKANCLSSARQGGLLLPGSTVALRAQGAPGPTVLMAEPFPGHGGFS